MTAQSQEIAPGNNPDQLTREQVGEGYRLLTTEEVEARAKSGCGSNLLIELRLDGKWSSCGHRGKAIGYTYRVPVSAGSFMPEPAEPVPAELNPTQEQAAAWQAVYDKLASLPGFNESWQETDTGRSHALRTIDELVARAEKAEAELAEERLAPHVYGKMNIAKLEQERDQLRAEVDAAHHALELSNDAYSDLHRILSAAQEDKALLDSRCIILTVHGERVEHIGVDLRKAIRAAVTCADCAYKDAPTGDAAREEAKS